MRGEKGVTNIELRAQVNNGTEGDSDHLESRHNLEGGYALLEVIDLTDVTERPDQLVAPMQERARRFPHDQGRRYLVPFGSPVLRRDRREYG